MFEILMFFLIFFAGVFAGYFVRERKSRLRARIASWERAR